MNILCFFPSTQWQFWSVCWPDTWPYDLFGRRVAEEGLCKWIDSLQVLFLHYSKLPIWKENQIQCFRDSLCYWFVKHLVEGAGTFEGDRMWILCEMRCVKLSVEVWGIVTWNSSQVWSEVFGIRWGGVSLNWNDRLVEASLTQEAQPWTWAEYLWLFHQALLFVYSFLANFSGKFLWKIASPPPPVLQHIILLALSRFSCDARGL